jgi:putative PEP-CTERM system TPR-repeat lipoprotein
LGVAFHTYKLSDFNRENAMREYRISTVNSLLRLALASCILAIAACDNSTSSTQYMSRAEQQFEARHYGKAIVELKHALDTANDEQEALPRARWMLGMSYLKTGNMAAAAKELMRAKELGWDPDEILPALAKALLSSGEFTQVMDLSTAGLDARVAAKLQVHQALALLELGDIWTADTYLSKAAELRPNDIEVQLAKVRILGASGDIDGALAAIDRLLEAQPKRRDAWSHKGDLLSIQGRLPEARAAFEVAIKLSPKNSEARLKRGLINLHLQQLKKVVPDLKFLRRAAPKSPTTNYLRGAMDFHNGDYADSITALTLARPAAQQYPLILFYLAKAYLAQGNDVEALRQAERQVSLNPTFAPGRILLAKIYIKKSNAKDAQVALRPVLDADPTDSLSLNLMAKAMILDRKTHQALKILRTLQQMVPQSAIAHLELGAGLLSAGQGEAANQQFEAALALDPTLEQAAILRIQYLNTIQDFSGALEAAKDYAHHHPESVQAHTLLGRNYLVNELVDEAIAAFNTALSLAPGDPAANRALALIEQDLGNTAASRARYQAILAKRPDHLPTLLYFAVLAAEPGNEANMVAQLRHAIEVHPDALEPKLMLARYYVWKNTPNKIPALFAFLSELQQQSPEVLRLMAISQIAEQQYGKALYNLQQLVKSEPDTALVHHLLATAAAGTGDLEQTREALKRAEELDENFAPTLLSLTWLAWADGKAPLFDRYLQRLNRLVPNAPEVLRLQAVAAERDGETARAIELSRQLLATTPGTKAMLNLAGYLHVAGRSTEALQVVQDWVSNSPADIEARLALAKQLAELGQTKEAIQQFREVVKRQPQNVDAVNSLARYLRGEQPLEPQDFAQLTVTVNPGSTAILETLALIDSDVGKQQGMRCRSVTGEPEPAVSTAMTETHYCENNATVIETFRNIIGGDNTAFTDQEKAQQLLASVQNSLANAY